MAEKREEFVTGEEASRILGFRRFLVDLLVAKGELPTYRIPGGRRRFKRSDLIRYLKEKGPPAGSGQGGLGGAA